MGFIDRVKGHLRSTKGTSLVNRDYVEGSRDREQKRYDKAVNDKLDETAEENKPGILRWEILEVIDGKMNADDAEIKDLFRKMDDVVTDAMAEDNVELYVKKVNKFITEQAKKGLFLRDLTKFNEWLGNPDTELSMKTATEAVGLEWNDANKDAIKNALRTQWTNWAPKRNAIATAQTAKGNAENALSDTHEGAGTLEDKYNNAKAERKEIEKEITRRNLLEKKGTYFAGTTNKLIEETAREQAKNALKVPYFETTRTKEDGTTETVAPEVSDKIEQSMAKLFFNDDKVSETIVRTEGGVSSAPMECSFTRQDIDNLFTLVKEYSSKKSDEGKADYDQLCKDRSMYGFDSDGNPTETREPGLVTKVMALATTFMTPDEVKSIVTYASGHPTAKIDKIRKEQLGEVLTFIVDKLDKFNSKREDEVKAKVEELKPGVIETIKTSTAPNKFKDKSTADLTSALNAAQSAENTAKHAYDTAKESLKECENNLKQAKLDGSKVPDGIVQFVTDDLKAQLTEKEKEAVRKNRKKGKNSVGRTEEFDKAIYSTVGQYLVSSVINMALSDNKESIAELTKDAQDQINSEIASEIEARSISAVALTNENEQVLTDLFGASGLRYIASSAKKVKSEVKKYENVVNVIAGALEGKNGPDYGLTTIYNETIESALTTAYATALHTYNTSMISEIKVAKFRDPEKWSDKLDWLRDTVDSVRDKEELQDKKKEIVARKIAEYRSKMEGSFTETDRVLASADHTASQLRKAFIKDLNETVRGVGFVHSIDGEQLGKKRIDEIEKDFDKSDIKKDALKEIRQEADMKRLVSAEFKDAIITNSIGNCVSKVLGETIKVGDEDLSLKDISNFTVEQLNAVKAQLQEKIEKGKAEAKESKKNGQDITGKKIEAQNGANEAVGLLLDDAITTRQELEEVREQVLTPEIKEILLTEEGKFNLETVKKLYNVDAENEEAIKNGIADRIIDDTFAEKKLEEARDHVEDLKNQVKGQSNKADFLDGVIDPTAKPVTEEDKDEFVESELVSGAEPPKAEEAPVEPPTAEETPAESADEEVTVDPPKKKSMFNLACYGSATEAAKRFVKAQAALKSVVERSAKKEDKELDLPPEVAEEAPKETRKPVKLTKENILANPELMEDIHFALISQSLREMFVIAQGYNEKYDRAGNTEKQRLFNEVIAKELGVEDKMTKSVVDGEMKYSHEEPAHLGNSIYDALDKCFSDDPKERSEARAAVMARRKLFGGLVDKDGKLQFTEEANERAKEFVENYNWDAVEEDKKETTMIDLTTIYGTKEDKDLTPEEKSNREMVEAAKGCEGEKYTGFYTDKIKEHNEALKAALGKSEDKKDEKGAEAEKGGAGTPTTEAPVSGTDTDPSVRLDRPPTGPRPGGAHL